MGIYANRNYTIDDARNSVLAEIESWYGNAVLDTFDCNVLGAAYRYYCAESDQLRMLNGRTANVTQALMCGRVPAVPDAALFYEWVDHTSAECGKVHTAYVAFTKDAATRYQALKARAAATTTVAECEIILNELCPQAV